MNCGKFTKGTNCLSASNWATCADRTATLACTICTLARLRLIASANRSGRSSSAGTCSGGQSISPVGGDPNRSGSSGNAGGRSVNAGGRLSGLPSSTLGAASAPGLRRPATVPAQTTAPETAATQARVTQRL